MTKQELEVALINIGQRIKKSRKKAKLSMAELGERVGIHHSTISRYEAGYVQSLDIDKLIKIAKVLNVSADYLMGWDVNEVGEEEKLLKPISKYLKASDFTKEEAKQIIDYCRFIILKRGH